MSRIKSSSNNSNSVKSFDINKISPNLRIECSKILNDMQHQLFFDQDLPHEHLMFILNRRHTIENELIQFLYDRIDNLNIPHDVREGLIENVNRFSTNFTPISINSNINYRYYVNYDSDEESYNDYQTDTIDSDENDDYDDLENLILDEMEMEHDIAVFHDTQENKDEHTINNNNAHHFN